MQRRVIPDHPVDIRLTLSPLRHGAGDPCLRFERGEAWRASRTPDGPATLRLSYEGTSIDAAAWGPGAEWALEQTPELLGIYDDPRPFVPRHPLLRDLHRRMRGLRMCRARTLAETLFPTILDQKVTSAEANRSYLRLLRTFGEAAPGPRPMKLPLDPQTIASIPYHGLHRFGVERRRAEILRRAARELARAERAGLEDPGIALRRLGAIHGIGPWTLAKVARAAYGDPDAVVVGDYHIPHIVAWSLAGIERSSDEEMLELLAPYQGQRGRAQRLLEIGGSRAPRYAPGLPKRSIAGI